MRHVVTGEPWRYAVLESDQTRQDAINNSSQIEPERHTPVVLSCTIRAVGIEKEVVYGTGQ